MIVTALISGLVGSLITIICKYYIENYRRRRQLCFIYIVKISEIVATQVVLKRLIARLKDLCRDSIANVKKDNYDFELSHIICAAVVKAMQKAQLSDFQAFAPLLRAVKEKLDKDSNHFMIENELLLFLPDEAIVQYCLFRRYLDALADIVSFWVLCIETGNIKLINSQDVCSHWVSIKELFNAANELWTSLISRGKIEKAEAEKILDRQIEVIYQHIRSYIECRPKLKKAIKFLEKEIIKEKESDN